jgi:hypothetical protein
MKDAFPVTNFPMLRDSLRGNAATLQLLLDHVDCVRLEAYTIRSDPVQQVVRIRVTNVHQGFLAIKFHRGFPVFIALGTMPHTIASNWTRDFMFRAILFDTLV